MLREEIKTRSGFTLIELVIVIVLLGILAATALPRFAKLTDQARAAANDGVAGGLGAAVAIAHAAWYAGGAPTTAGSSVELEGIQVSVNTAGWPAGTSTDPNTIAAGDCATVWNNVLNNPPYLQTNGTTCPADHPECYLVGAPDVAQQCKFVLGADSTLFINYDASQGTVSTSPISTTPAP